MWYEGLIGLWVLFLDYFDVSHLLTKCYKNLNKYVHKLLIYNNTVSHSS
jgi:hypothetical protein